MKPRRRLDPFSTPRSYTNNPNNFIQVTYIPGKGSYAYKLSMHRRTDKEEDPHTIRQSHDLAIVSVRENGYFYVVKRYDKTIPGKKPVTVGWSLSSRRADRMARKMVEKIKEDHGAPRIVTVDNSLEEKARVNEIRDYVRGGAVL